MITYTRSEWYGFSYLWQRSGSLVPRALPAAIFAGVVAGFVHSNGFGQVEDADHNFREWMGHANAMQVFGIVFG